MNKKPLTGLDRANINRDDMELHGGRREEAALLFGIPPEELLDFSSSINLLGPPPGVARAIRGATTQIAYYPEERGGRMAKTISDYLSVFPDEVMPGNGSIELIYWLAAALKPKKALIVEPTFSEYRRACQATGTVCDPFLLKEEDGFVFDGAQLDPEGYDLVFLCNPNNPTGYLVPVDEIADLWKRCRTAGAGLVVDEAFIDFAGADASVLAFGAVRGLYVLRSFTKSHALAGLRLGCLVTDAAFLEKLKSMMPPWNINIFARAAGESALADRLYLNQTWRELYEAKRKLSARLSAISGVEPLPSEANFILCRISGVSSSELWERLARDGILVRDCSSFAGMGVNYIRIAIKSQRDNYQLVVALEKAING